MINTARCGLCGADVPLSEAWHHRSVCGASREKALVGLVEHVARAIAVEEGARPDMWVAYAGHAREAIGAMREPTIAMIGAGAIAGAVSNDAAAAVWQAMIERAGAS